MYFPADEVMWYSSSVYQIRPYGDVPSDHALLEKSSVNDVSDERVLLFELLLLLVLRFPFVFVFEFLFVFRLVFVLAFATRLLLSFVIFIIATTKTPAPTTRSTTITPMPNSHGQRLRFRGALGGSGDHGGWLADGGGGGGGALPGKATVGGGVVSRPDGY